MREATHARGRVLCAFLLLTTLLAGGRAYALPNPEGQGAASQEDAILVYDADGLLAMSDDPDATYRLMCDIDLADVTWKPFEFHGTLDGNGHAILNAQVTDVAAERHTTYDGNSIPYETTLSGFFGSLDGATVRDVDFLGISVDVRTDDPTFVGTVCGYMSDSSIEDCSIVGEASLSTTGASFGVGGIAGFGAGSIANTSADTTLVCIDRDGENKDEQFMGGAYAGGYIDLESCDVTIQGFDSDHGYVHNGGLVGLYINYENDDHMGTVSNNNVKGTITFFEDNLDRRAYCEAVIGENMSSWAVDVQDNDEDFVRDEVFEYDVDLVPHNCDEPSFTEEHHASSCEEHGYTLRTCKTCGYAQRTAFEPVAHEVATWTTAETLSDGSVAQQGTCERCGADVYQVVAASEVTNTTDVDSPSSANVSSTTDAAAHHDGPGVVVWIVVAVIAAIIVLAVILAVWMSRRRKVQMRRAQVAAAQRRVRAPKQYQGMNPQAGRQTNAQTRQRQAKHDRRKQ